MNKIKYFCKTSMKPTRNYIFNISVCLFVWLFERKSAINRKTRARRSIAGRFLQPNLREFMDCNGIVWLCRRCVS